GVRSRAYLLLDPITNNALTLEAADTLGSNPEQMFHNLLQLSTKYQANGSYSMYRYLDNYSHEAMRKLNRDAANPNTQFDAFSHYSPEEMFVLLSYGYK